MSFFRDFPPENGGFMNFLYSVQILRIFLVSNKLRIFSLQLFFILKKVYHKNYLIEAALNTTYKLWNGYSNGLDGLAEHIASKNVPEFLLVRFFQTFNI